MKKSKAMKFLEQISGEEISFAMTLRAYRTRESLTQEELADKLGTKKDYISNLENKRDFVTVDQAMKFAKRLKEPFNVWVTVALQDMVDRAGVGAKVKLVA